MPRNVQKDFEASRAWVLKDEVIARGKVYYGKVYKGHSMFLAPRMIPVFNAIWGCSKKGEAGVLSKNAQKVLKVLRKEWEMATADLRDAMRLATCRTHKSDRRTPTRMKVVPQEVSLHSKIHIHLDARRGAFPKELSKKMKREDAVRELAAAICKCAG